MRIVTSIDKLLHTISGWPGQSTASPGIVTGLPAIDSLLPAGGFATRSEHEVLGTTGFPSVILPVLVARAAAKTGWIVWCDFARRFYCMRKGHG